MKFEFKNLDENNSERVRGFGFIIGNFAVAVVIWKYSFGWFK